MRISHLLVGGFACLATAALAVETKNWIQSEAAEFERGTLKGLSLSSNGRVRLAPVFKEVFDSSVALLWAGAADSKGVLFAGGSGGKLFAIDGQAKGKTVVELPGGDIYAIAINARDEVFAATAPEGKVYRIVAGKPEVFYDTKTKYVWALRFDRSGALYVATGDPGQIHRVAPDGKGSVLIDLEETHARSLAFDKAGNVIVGTEPGGLVLRVTPRGEGFILYQTARREVTSLAVAADGTIYAAGVGTKPAAGAPAPTTPPQPTPVPSPSPGPAGVQISGPRVPPPPTLGAAPSVSGGSEIYRINPDGEPRRIWSNAQHLVYALALDGEGRVLVGTGNQGLIYRLDSETVSTRWLDAEAGQVTALVPGSGGAIFALTSNIGRAYQIGPGVEKTGTVESEVFDAGSFSYWGRLRHEGADHGGSISIETRSGNLDRPQKNWSPWAPLKDGRVASPPARFLEWRATLHAAPGGQSPELSSVDAAWQAKNVAPVLERIEVTPANYKFPSSSLSLSSSTSLTLPPMGQPRRSTPTPPALGEGGSQTMNYDKGWVGARWRASDVNGDSLEAKIEIRGKDEREWKLLKDSVRDSKYAWDSGSWPDGEYRLRVTVSDAPDNYPDEALSAQIESEPFVIDNTPPQISGLTARVQGGRLVLQFKAADALSPLGYAEYSINGGEWKYAPPTTRLTDSRNHEFLVDIARPAGAELTIAVKISDSRDNLATDKTLAKIQ
jgi:outer membrane protein assembly factor BamB